MKRNVVRGLCLLGGLLFVALWLFDLTIFWVATSSGFHWNHLNYTIFVRWAFLDSFIASLPGSSWLSGQFIATGVLIISTSLLGIRNPGHFFLLPASVITCIVGLASLVYSRRFLHQMSPVVVSEIGSGMYVVLLSFGLLLGAGLSSLALKRGAQ